jgi:hypothetical protein
VLDTEPGSRTIATGLDKNTFIEDLFRAIGCTMRERAVGLLLVVVGLAFAAVGFLLFRDQGWPRAVASLPLVLAMAGWLKLVTGWRFGEIEEFTAGESWAAFGRALLVFFAVVVFVAALLVVGFKIGFFDW